MSRKKNDMLVRKGLGDFDPIAFIDRYMEVYENQSNRNGFKTKKSFSPSTLGYNHGTCPRYWYIAFSGAEFKESVDSQSQANMDNGTSAHERIQKVMRDMGCLESEELEIVNQNPPIRGFVDVVINWNGSAIPGEIKTARSESFGIRVATGKPTPSHYVQFLIYLKTLKAREGFLIYENKNDMSLCVIMVYANEKTVADANYLWDWMGLTYGAWRGSLLPEKPWTRANAKICSACPVQEECNSEKYGKGDLVLLPLVVPEP